MDDTALAASETSFGAWIQQRRKALGLTQEELARLVTCSVSAIRKVERDERRPSRQVAELLAEALNVPPERREAFVESARGVRPLDRLHLSPTAIAAPSLLDLPSGTVTFLMTDIEGSTRLWEKSPGTMRSALERHDDILQALVQQHGGRVIKMTGDGCHTVFLSAPAASEAAVAIQQAMTAETWPEPIGRLKVRAALHTGTAEMRGGDYYGQTVNRVARLMAAGHGGQVLLTQSTANLIAYHLPSGAKLTRLGRFQLRDLPLVEEVYQLSVTGLLAEFPPLRTEEQVQGYLPAPSTPLVGRETELEALTRTLLEPGCRLLTLIGPGGIGKSRLAIEAAFRLQSTFPDGAYFVPLASLTGADLVIPAIADALGLTFQGPAEPITQLLNHLHGKRVLLLLDNAEHLPWDVGLMGQICQNAPGTKMLATSRERLNLQGEWLFEVEGLPVPPAGMHGPLEEYSAATMFIQSVRRVQPDFEPREAERAAVARICRLVEGTPLGLELAAAWAALLSCQEIAAEIERNLDFLTTSMRDVPERQRSLRAVFDHSWRLLSEEEREALRRLSIFSGGFSREAAERVAQAPLMMLMALVSKSLVRRNASGRLDLHGLVRQFALARLLLEAPDEEARLRERFCSYYADLMQAWEVRLKSHEAMAAISEMSADVGNLRQAWSWMITQRQTANLVRSEFSLWWFHEMRGWIQEGIELMRQAAEGLRDPGRSAWDSGGDIESGELLGRVLLRQAVSLMRRGSFDLAFEQLQESLDLLKPGRDRAVYAYGLRQLGTVDFVWGNYDRALELMQESVAIFRTVRDPWGLSGSLLMLGDVLRVVGEFPAAYQASAESVQVARSLGEPRMLAASLRYLAQVTPLVGKAAEAQRLLEESLQISRAIQDRWSQARTLSSLGEIALHRREAVRAEGYYRESLDLFRQVGDEASQPDSRAFLGEALLAQGDLAGASDAFRQALAAAIEMHLPSVALGAMSGIAAMWAEDGGVDAALELAAFTKQHPANYPEAIERVAALVDRLKARTTPDQAEAAEARARERTLEETAAELLAVPPGSGGPFS